MTVEITEPGVYPDLPEETYHADPVPGGSLSSTGARRVLACPAKFRHEQEYGQQHKRAFDFGSAAHKYLLGTGPDIVDIDAEDYRTKAARAARDEAHAHGQVPMLRHEREHVEAMAEQIRQHPIASAVLTPGSGGLAELSLFWRHAAGQMCRARIDWLRQYPRRTVIVDYKTAANAEPRAIEKSVYDWGYHQQAAWYLDGAQARDLADEYAAFLLVVQEKTPPYVVTVAEVAPTALMWGRVLNRKAIDIYQRCTETGEWPGYATDVVPADLPPWADKQYDIAYDQGAYDIERTA